jgi:hypothetical protein
MTADRAMVRIEQRLAAIEEKLDAVLAAIADLQIAALSAQQAQADEKAPEPAKPKRGK